MQLSLFTLPPPSRQPRRRTYTMKDFRVIKADYTEGWLKGPEMAKKLGVPYRSFKQFIKRNPDLKKGYHSK